MQTVSEAKPLKMIHGVPFYSQEEYQCGPASLAGVMNFWKISITPADIAQDIFSKTARGTLNIDMVFYPATKGLSAEQYSGSINDLRQRIDAGYPLVVLVDYGFSVFQANHFMVVVGYSSDSVIVNSGKEEGKHIPMDEFLKTWEKTKYWTLLIKIK